MSGDGRYGLAGRAVTVKDGVARLDDGGSIAGSTLTLDAAVRRAVDDVGISVADAIAAVTSVPAAAIGRAGDLGALAPGFAADAVLLDADLTVEAVWADGRRRTRALGHRRAPVDSAARLRHRGMQDLFPVLAGSISTVIFAASYLPMLVKAVRTKDLASYSQSSLLLTNLGNAVHSLYVFSLPAGPIWALHTFYLVSSALMTTWYLRYARLQSQAARGILRDADHVARRVAERAVAGVAHVDRLLQHLGARRARPSRRSRRGRRCGTRGSAGRP